MAVYECHQEYNYIEDNYERDHEMFPERVMLGSENFPKEIGYRWPLVESHPYIIGDFTWTAWDYLGEAGIGKVVYVDENDPLVEKGSWELMPPSASPFPWRTANDADFDITGNMLAQGAYRSVVWGSQKTHLFSMHPKTFHKVEMITMWGFPEVLSCWNYAGYEGQGVELVVYSNAEEVEVLVNGKSIGRKAVCMERPMPYSARFETIYAPGKVEAISYSCGKEISRDVLVTAKEPEEVYLTPEKLEMRADGHDLICVGIEIRDADGCLVPDASVPLKVKVDGSAVLAGFGSGNPITDEDYTNESTVSYRGRAMAIIRSGYESGRVHVEVSAEGMKPVQLELSVVSFEKTW